MTIVLIVDDEKALRDGLSDAVRDLGYAPVVASSGREALAVAAQTNPDAALLDLRMPDMDGLQVLTRLRSEAGGAKLPVAIITAYATAANTIEAMRLGAFDHLTKPVGREDLASLLARMVRSRAPRIHRARARRRGRRIRRTSLVQATACARFRRPSAWSPTAMPRC